jgi:hypothetical protein
MNYGKDDHQMWTYSEAEEIQKQANARGHAFGCECSDCTRTKKMELLLRTVRTE